MMHRGIEFRPMRVLAAVVCLLAVPATTAAQDAVREITEIAGDVYRFQNNNHYSVFMVTPDGIVATDPIDAAAAAWLKAEMEKRFPVPVRYLVYSHDHADHISGGEVFADTATVVAHDRARDHIVAGGVPTAVPDVTFSDRMTLHLGGKTVELTYTGPNHGDSVIVARFPEERILFAVDIVTADRLPYRDLPDADIDAWIETLKRLETMDYDILAPGHGRLGTRADVAPHRRYFEDLRAEVRKHMDAGLSLDEIKAAVDLDAYSHFGQFEAWKDLNVEGMHRYLSGIDG